MLIITDDKKLTDRLLDPRYGHKRTYTVQVEGDISREAIDMLRIGMTLNINGKKHFTQKAFCEKLQSPPPFDERIPPVRFRQNIPTSWIRLTITEGKNRQVRKMTAATGYPTLRLIRTGIEKLSLEGMKPGEVRETEGSSLYKLLNMS